MKIYKEVKIKTPNFKLKLGVIMGVNIVNC